MSANSAIYNPSQTTSAATGDGFSVPRLTTTGRLAITFTTADKGMMVYDTTLDNLFIWNGAAWESVPASGDSSNTQVIFNDNGILAGDSGLTYAKTAQRLTVTGNIDIWNGANATNTNIAVGRDALGLTAAGAGANTAVGRQAGRSVLTGSNNAFFGYQAGFGTATGANNVAVGATALFVNTTGGGNTAVGFAALGSQTGTGSVGIGVQAGQDCIGNYNTFIGYAAAQKAASSTQCIAIGVDAFSGDASRAHTGSYNIAVGSLALYSSNNITGADNIAIGRETGRSISSGRDNVLIGRTAGVNMTTAEANVCVGQLTGTTISTGNYNVAVGTGCGNKITVGSQNTAVGIDALSGNAGIAHSGNFNVAIGPAAMYSANNITGSDNIGIGRDTLRNLSTGIYNVGIGLRSLNALQSGASNVALGYRSLESNLVTSNLVAIGIDALRLNAGGTQNTAVGAFSLANNSAGTNCTAVGNQALNKNAVNNNTAVGNASSQNLVAGSENTSLGAGSLFTCAVGTRNVAIGYNSNVFGTGGYNVAIGAEAAAGAAFSGSYNVIIGDGAGGLISTGQSNIVLGIGAQTSSPTASNQLSIGNGTYYVATNGAAATYFPNAVTGTVLPPAGSSGFIRFLLNGSVVKVAVYAD